MTAYDTHVQYDTHTFYNPAAVTTIPTLQYLVAFQNNPTDDPALITTVATPAGTLGGNNVWTDITPFVGGNGPSHIISRGRQHELAQMEAGTCQLSLNNVDARFNPWNTGSPYYGYLLPRKQLQVRATYQGVTYYRFTGHVDAWPVDWPDPISGWARLHATDAFRLFQLANLTTAGYPAQVIADGATGYWRLGDLGPTTALDSAGTHNGLYQGAETFGGAGALPGNPSTSVSFESGSTPTGYVNLPGAVGPHSQTYTIEAWVNSSSWTNSEGGIWFSYDGVGGEIVFQVQDTGIGPALQFTTVDDTFADLLVDATTVQVPADGAWHHVVVTRTPNANPGLGVTFYQDGVPVTSASVPGHNHNVAAITPTGAQIAAQGLAIFPGSLQEVAVYDGIALTAAQVANHYQLAAWPQETSGSRIGRVLNTLGWSSTARNIDTGNSTMQANIQDLTTTSALLHMQDVEATEAGALFMTAAGQVRFMQRSDFVSLATFTTPQAQFGDTTTDIPFDPAPQLALDDLDLWNEAYATRVGGLKQVWDNTTSQTQFGRSTWQPAGALIGISDADVLHLLQYVVSRYGTPPTAGRLSAITIDLLNLLHSGNAGALLALDLLYLVTVERTSPPGGGTPFSQQSLIEKIQETVTPNSWKITLALNPADTQQYWILGTSQLGTNTRVFF